LLTSVAVIAALVWLVSFGRWAGGVLLRRRAAQ
jgi:hypothetical protein